MESLKAPERLFAAAPADESAVSSTPREMVTPRETVAPREAAPAFGHTPEYLLEVRLTVSAEIGRVQLPVRQVMQLGPGALIELQRSASEPVDIFANGHCIARGEIVVIGEHFGVRVTELGSELPAQR